MDAIERIRKEGYDDAFTEGFNEGFIIAFNESRIKTEAEFQERLLKIAKELIKEGFSLEFIANAVRLDAQELANLQSKIG